MTEKEVDVSENSPRRPELGLWDFRSNMGDDLFFLVSHLFMALFSKNWALGLARNIAPTRELESFGPGLRGDLFDVFRMVCKLSGRFTYGDSFLASFLPGATCLLKTKH
ncbi:hypothetical protein PIB30_090574 [Stylosanthes scabra]|uniref:Uncharacterized protein n=1 Tax=Stylosanthes scabra TaxID=79078 RepID=A0ABU6TTV4_9FABA|nr:hypothetical protein [Stylosanthes scabra]